MSQVSVSACGRKRCKVQIPLQPQQPPQSPTCDNSTGPQIKGKMVTSGLGGCVSPLSSHVAVHTQTIEDNIENIDKVTQLSRSLGLIGDPRSGGTILEFAAANWVFRAVVAMGGNLPRAIDMIRGTIAQGSLHITMTDDDLVIWSRSEAHTSTHVLAVPLKFLSNAPAGALLRDLVRLGAWREVLRSLAYNNEFPRCRRPVQWMREAMRCMLVEAKARTLQAVEVTLRCLVVYNPRLERDMVTWIKVSGWKEGESGGRRGEGEVIGELGREKKKKISV